MTGFKTHTQAFGWTERDSWRWPKGDTKLLQVIDQVADIDTIMAFVEGRHVCVQAGGACGIWPLRFSQFFEQVFTFEPQPDNFKCLVKNTRDADNIVAVHAPLSNTHASFSIHNDIMERANYGAGYLIPDPNGLKAVSIDDLALESCDLIQLDVEGFELQALQGGIETIGAFRPVIVLEEKRLNHVQGDPARARKWLERTFDYKQVGSAHRDVILAC